MHPEYVVVMQISKFVPLHHKILSIESLGALSDLIDTWFDKQLSVRRVWRRLKWLENVGAEIGRNGPI